LSHAGDVYSLGVVARNLGIDLCGGRMTAEDPKERPSCKEIAMEAEATMEKIRLRAADISGFIDKLQIYMDKRICKWSNHQSRKSDREVRQGSDRMNNILTILSGS